MSEAVAVYIGAAIGAVLYLVIDALWHWWTEKKMEDDFKW